MGSSGSATSTGKQFAKLRKGEMMKTNQCSEGFDNPSKFREEWDKQTQGK